MHFSDSRLPEYTSLTPDSLTSLVSLFVPLGSPGSPCLFLPDLPGLPVWFFRISQISYAQTLVLELEWTF